MINDEADEVIEEPFDSFNKYQNFLKSMKGS